MKKFTLSLLTAFALTLTLATTTAAACPGQDGGSHAKGAKCEMGEKCKMHKKSAKNKKAHKKENMNRKVASGGNFSEACQKQRAHCGSKCNTEAGDDDEKWNECFAPCSQDCDNSAPAAGEAEAGDKE